MRRGIDWGPFNPMLTSPLLTLPVEETPVCQYTTPLILQEGMRPEHCYAHT